MYESIIIAFIFAIENDLNTNYAIRGAMERERTTEKCSELNALHVVLVFLGSTSIQKELAQNYICFCQVIYFQMVLQSSRNYLLFFNCRVSDAYGHILIVIE